MKRTDENLVMAVRKDEPASRMRRDLVRWLTIGAVGGVASSWLLGCGGDDDAGGNSTSSSGGGGTGSSSGSGGDGTCAAQPRETNGPYPADGTNASNQTLNALVLSGFARSDIRQSVGSASGTAAGVPLKLKLKVVNTNDGCAALPGYAVYVWSCTADGGYSMYTTGITNENYLRGLQVADENGELEFTTIFPGCYSGRWPHIHFEVYPSESVATTDPAGDWKLVSQIALPEDTCRVVYAQSGYESSVSNLNRITLSRDNVFSDGYATQMASVTGDVSSGYTASLTIGIAV